MGQSENKKRRPLDVAANIAVAIVLLFSVITTVGALMKVGTPSAAGIAGGLGGLTGVVFGAILVCYAVVIARAPSMLRWGYALVLAVLFFFAFKASLAGGTAEQHTASAGSAVVGLLVVAALICGPLVWYRVRMPKKKAVAAES